MNSACSNNKELHPFNLSDADYKVVMNKSIVSTGNNARLKNVIKKLEKGQDVYIAVIGGSVTEGAGIKDSSGKELWERGYAFKFIDQIKEKFPKANDQNIHFDPAGLSGTSSAIGLVRYDDDVTKVLDHTPDLLIIEFAVNDDGDDYIQRSFEALIRKALIENDDTAVIAMFSDARSYKNSQELKIPVCKLYEIPMISIQDAVENSGIKINENEFFDDYVHPKEDGHKLMADSLMYLFSLVKAEKTAVKNALPSKTLHLKSLESIKRISGDDENVKIVAGEFNSVDQSTQTIKKTGKPNFSYNWHRSAAATTNDGLKMEINCRALAFMYKEQGNWEKEKFGKAEIYVDGVLAGTFDGGKQGGWNNCIIRMLIDSDTAKNHTVEIKMAPGDENKGFTIVAMSYVK